MSEAPCVPAFERARLSLISLPSCELHFLAKQLVQLPALRALRKSPERALPRNLLGRLHEPRSGHARQRATDADAADAGIGEALHAQPLIYRSGSIRSWSTRTTSMTPAPCAR